MILQDANKPITFKVPAAIRWNEVLPLHLAPWDGGRWLVSTIGRKVACHATDEWGVVRLHSDILRRVLGPRYAAVTVGALKEAGVIETLPYRAGIRSTGFRIAAKYLDQRCLCVPATDERLIERIRRELVRLNAERQQKASWLPIHAALKDQQQGLTIADEADGVLRELPDHSRFCQSVLVEHLRAAEHPFAVGRTGRVYNSITSLKRELRRTVRLDGAHVAGLDIRCSQPALLANVLAQTNPTRGYKKRTTYMHAGWCSPLCPSPGLDLSVFLSAALDGSLYDSLGPDRETVKRQVLRDVLAKRGNYPSAVEQTFAAKFPSVYRAIREINKTDHASLIRLLQRAESWLVIEQVAPRLLARGLRIVTLHDAVFSQADKIDVVADIFARVLGEVGWQLSLKREVASCG